MKNISGALKVCQQLKISEERFYQALKYFKGPMRQLQLLGKNATVNVYRDYVYSPLKMNATIKAIRELYPLRELVVCMEVGSDGDVPENFWKQYDDSMRLADEKFVFFSQGGKNGGSEAMEHTVHRPQSRCYNLSGRPTAGTTY